MAQGCHPSLLEKIPEITGRLAEIGGGDERSGADA